MGVGILVAIATFGIVGSVTRFYVLQTEQTGVMEGLLSAICVSWPFFYQANVKRYNFLHPVPRRYTVPQKQAYAKLRKLLDEKTYNFGDKWHITTADTIERRISATLKFTDEETKLEGNSLNNIHTKTERFQRLIELDIQFKEEPSDTVVVQLDFRPRAEGSNWAACDPVIRGLTSDVETILGPGTDAGDAADTTIPAPPWWVIGVGALNLLTLFGDIKTAVFK
jgi:hypothetical protein